MFFHSFGEDTIFFQLKFEIQDSTQDFDTCPYGHKPYLNTHADVFSGPRGLHFVLSLHLHPFFVYESKNAQARLSFRSSATQ